MKIGRREFLLLTAGILTGCQTAEDTGNTATGPTRAVDAGPAANYTADGVYGRYADVGFFVIRAGDKLFALSSYCTHRKCRVIAERDNSFYCKCHGSTFDPTGHVTLGPAKRDLPVLASFTNEQGQLVVQVAGK